MSGGHERTPNPARSPLLTDLYQLTMAQAAWKLGRHELRSVFHLTMRRCPFGGDFAIAAGIEDAVDYARELRFEADDLEYLASLPSSAGSPLFDPAFLDWLAGFRSRCDVHAVREGETVLAGTPLVRVEGGLLDAQLLETPLLNLVGVQTLVATRAARICHWAAGAAFDGPPQPVLEFGLRRAHGPDGALSISRAAYLGGCAATSNLLAGRTFGIPVRGTHAHSWVLSFDEEIEAFRGFAEVFPDDTTLLVDSYSTERGLERAATVGRELQKQGHELSGIRLDSGDLGALSRLARQILDGAGLLNARVAASGDLDEGRIEKLRRSGARVDLWGVGARLATSRGDASFSGAYKLAAIEEESGAMRPVAKISEDRFKRSLPGRLQVRRRLEEVEGVERLVGDVVYDVDLGFEGNGGFRENGVSGGELGFGEKSGFERGGVPEPSEQRSEDLLHPALRGGRRVGAPEGLEGARRHAARCAGLLGWKAIDAQTDSRPVDEAAGPPSHAAALEVDAAVEQRMTTLLARQNATNRL